MNKYLPIGMFLRRVFSSPPAPLPTESPDSIKQRIDRIGFRKPVWIKTRDGRHFNGWLQATHDETLVISSDYGRPNIVIDFADICEIDRFRFSTK